MGGLARRSAQLSYFAIALALMPTVGAACGAAAIDRTGRSQSRVASQAALNSPREVTPAASSPASVASESRTTSPSPVARASCPACNLPFILSGSGQQTTLQGGFVSGPGGRFSSDQAGQMTADRENTPVTVASPILRGSFSTPTGSYDRAVQRWLPVSRDVVRSDGLEYAYAEGYKVNPDDQFESQTHVHVVSLPGGADRVVYSGGPYTVVAFEPEGIYLAAVRYYSGEGSSGLWLLNPGDGAIVKLFDAIYFVGVGAGYGWVENTPITPTVLTRLDLKSGARQEWANVAGTGWISFVGTDLAGHPFVNVTQFGSPASELVLYAGPGQSVPLGNFSIWSSSSVSDRNGTWFGGQDGIYLFSELIGLRKVSDVGYGVPARDCR
jgi:hypothetical protein